MNQRQPELVLLVEPDGANLNGKLRTAVIAAGQNAIIERSHLDPKDPSNPNKQWIRTWVNKDGERDETGRCRVFREELPPPPPEEPEKPLYDELYVRDLPFTIEEAKKR